MVLSASIYNNGRFSDYCVRFVGKFRTDVGCDFYNIVCQLVVILEGFLILKNMKKFENFFNKSLHGMIFRLIFAAKF